MRRLTCSMLFTSVAAILLLGPALTAAQTSDGPLYPVSSCRPVEPAVIHRAALPVCDPMPEPFLVNRRLALIENNTVPCVDVDTMEAARCMFHAVPAFARTPGARATGHWLEDIDGRQYAVVGQPVTRDGSLGSGAFVIGTIPDADGSTPCVGASGQDSSGAVAGSTLAFSCVLESGGADTNATGVPLQNVVTGFVGTSSLVHPDGAERVAIDPERLVAWYTGRGAALNDPGGVERDTDNVYFGDTGTCHLVLTGGVMVPAAKRPATRSYPPPGAVNVNSPIRWRVANPYVTIANASCLEPRAALAPVASLDVSVGLTALYVDASASTGDIVRYIWDLDWTDAAPDAVTSVPTAQFPAAAEGAFTSGRIFLTVVARDGRTAGSDAHVNLQRPLPAPDIPEP